MAKIADLAEQQIGHFRRYGWAPGQFVHVKGYGYPSDDGRKPSSTEAVAAVCCFCSAPITAHDPLVGDDQWERYVGRETEERDRMDLALKAARAAFLAVLVEQGVVPEEGAMSADIGSTPDMPRHYFGPSMRA